MDRLLTKYDLKHATNRYQRNYQYIGSNTKYEQLTLDGIDRGNVTTNVQVSEWDEDLEKKNSLHEEKKTDPC
jgi:hypothetical protein